MVHILIDINSIKPQTSFSFVTNIWQAFTANFGGKLLKYNIGYIASYKTLLFFVFLDGVVMWISYRAFLFSELSTPHFKYPFDDLDSLSKSGYK